MECTASSFSLSSLIGVIISLGAFYLSCLAHKSSVITNIQNVLTEKAKECNAQIIPGTHEPPETDAAISVVLTNIIYAKRLLEMFRKDHAFLLCLTSDYHFVKFFYLQLHTSNIELVKNPLKLPPDTGNLNVFQDQYQECKEFLQNIINENPSQPKPVK